MRILFLLLRMSDNPKTKGMYVDLIEEFSRHCHDITVMAPDVDYSKTFIAKERDVRVLRLKSIPTEDVRNMIMKGIGLATLPFFFKRAYKKFLKKEIFDWILMPTPPITLIDFVSYVKKKSTAKFYLILRDIHPQSAASIGLIKYKFMYNYLAKIAEKGYEIADCIGCMSQGNIDFIAQNYPQLNKKKLVLLMNWQKDANYLLPDTNVRSQFELSGKFIALFGGNIGKGQRIENIISLAEHYLLNDNIVFIIIGKGVEKQRLERITKEKSLSNIRFLDFMPRDEYLFFIKSVDVGLITINENYKVPTCPSKAVSYMSLKIPILAMINSNNDYGKIIEEAGAGYWSVGSEKETTFRNFDRIYHDKNIRIQMGINGYNFYKKHLTSECAYNTLINQIDGKE